MLPAVRDLRGERPNVTIRKDNGAAELRLIESGSVFVVAEA